jgi:hypothetical protein
MAFSVPTVKILRNSKKSPKQFADARKITPAAVDRNCQLFMSTVGYPVIPMLTGHPPPSKSLNHFFSRFARSARVRLFMQLWPAGRPLTISSKFSGFGLGRLYCSKMGEACGTLGGQGREQLL